MRRALRCTFFPLAALLGASCAPRQLRPDFSLIRAWSPEIQALEPLKPPYLVEFRKASKTLYYIAAVHETHREPNPSSALFNLIRRAFDGLPVKAVILEGFPRRAGVNDPGIVDSLNKNYDGSEVMFSGRLAIDKGVPFMGGEPTQRERFDHFVAGGYTQEDVVNFDFLTAVEQYVREGKLAALGEEKTYAQHCASSLPEYGLPANSAMRYADFKRWYRDRNKKEFLAESVSQNETSGDGRPGQLFTQRMGAADVRFRDESILRTVVGALDRYNTVLVIYGAGHLAEQRLALESVWGRPIRTVNSL